MIVAAILASAIAAAFVALRVERRRCAKVVRRHARGCITRPLCARIVAEMYQ